jgi:hypothetical protein
VILGDDDVGSLGGGWYGPEREGEDGETTFRWMGRLGRLWLPADAEARVEIELAAYAPAGGPPAALTVEIDGTAAGPFALPDGGRRTIAIDLEGSVAGPGPRRVDLLMNRALRPTDVEPGCGDERPLGLRVFRARTTSRLAERGTPEASALAAHVALPCEATASATEARWIGAWTHRGDGTRVPERDGGGRFADVVIRPPADLEAEGASIALRYVDEEAGLFRVVVLDRELRPVARRAVATEGSGRPRAVRLPLPPGGVACLTIDPCGTTVPVLDVEGIRRLSDRLNLGSGPDHRPGMTNLDLRALAGTDVVADVTRLPYGDGSVGEILADDVLEHVPWARSGEVVAEWARVLRPGGTMTIRTPSLAGVLRLYEERPVGWRPEDGDGVDPVIERLYGGQDYPGNFHYAIFDERTLRTLLEGAGLRVMELGADGPDVSNLVAVAMRREAVTAVAPADVPVEQTVSA